jgi:hypothetical protein
MTGELTERVRVRIMTEAYDLADRGDLEGYNGIKMMCHDVLRIIEAHPLTDAERYRWLRGEFSRPMLEAFFNGYDARNWQDEFTQLDAEIDAASRS